MSIFRKKAVIAERKAVDIYEDLFKECETLIDKSFELSGMTLTDMLSEMDDENGKIVGECIASYKRMANLAMEQAQIVDSMNDKLDALSEQNEKMLEAINYLTVLTKN